ncbi:hypothetical protein HDZ31DRAFT_76921, partial [Schizophyllum fasciatum]
MRDRNRRAASKRAYYERNKEKLQAKARERYALERAKEPAKVDTVCRNTQHTVMGRDPERRRASKRAYYQRRNYDRLRIKRLNMYRKRWMMKHGVSRFLRRFRARVQAEEGQLLEHWDHGTLSSLALLYVTHIGPGRYTCLPPFHRPDAVGKNGVVFYVIFAPDEHAGIYLAWYQIKAIMRRYNLPKCALDLQSFITPEAAIASWSEFCRIAHDHRSAVPPLFPSHPFTLATYSDSAQQTAAGNFYAARECI